MLSKIACGHGQPSQELRKRIAALLESDEEWLFGGTEVPLRRTDLLDTPACSV
jgi:transcriptional regulator with XRE-family HTH domain